MCPPKDFVGNNVWLLAFTGKLCDDFTIMDRNHLVEEKVVTKVGE
jgi:hypothetical protein